MRIKKYHSILFFLLLLISFLFAQELDVPLELQLKLFAKVLSFDHNAYDRFKEGTNVAVLYQEKLRQSVQAKEGTRTFFDNNEWSEWETARTNVYYFDVSKVQNIDEKLAEHDVNVVLLLPVRNYDISKLAAICRSISATSLSAAPEYLSMGLSLGISLKSNKPDILLNIQAAKAEGANFSAGLLNIATIIE